MPELPEVETVLRGLEPRAVGRRITGVEIINRGVIIGDPVSFQKHLTGRLVAGLRRKGKALAINLVANGAIHGDCLLVRLGMTGQVVVTRRDAPLLPHTHVRMILNRGAGEIRYRDSRRFGRLRYCTREEVEKVFESLGPDALEMTEKQFRDSLHGRHGSIKAWLLNQQMLAGLGNIYADEALFEARIHPQTPAGKATDRQAGALLRAVRQVLRQAVALQGTSFRDYVDIEGRPGNFLPQLRVYQKTGEPCVRCGAAIRRIIICGRSSHFCPRCQRRPRHRPVQIAS